MALELPTGGQGEFWWQWHTKKPSWVLLKLHLFFARPVAALEVKCWHMFCLSYVFPYSAGMTEQASPGTSETLHAPQDGTDWSHENGKNSLF